MNRRKGTFQSENQLPEKISESYFPSENSLQKTDGFPLCKSNRKKESVLDALTWHHYYLNGHTATLQDFLDVQPLDYLPKMFRTVQKFLMKKRIVKPLWLGETSSAYGGGAHGLSDRYVGSFLWLDKLGRVLHSV